MPLNDRNLEITLKRLLNNLQKLPSVAVALSGGVDSSLLLFLALQSLGGKVIAITAASAIQPYGELETATALARKIGARHLIIETDELDDPDFVMNTSERCYHCKRRLFRLMISRARREGFKTLIHGVNVEDLSDYRPGIRAADELGVLAPLAQAGLSKPDIRKLAQLSGLPNWNRPAMACLATRIPYGTIIDRGLLAKIDRAEQMLRQLGVAHCRVRHHGNLACIEVAPEEIETLAKSQVRVRIVQSLKGLGYHFVGLDLEGYLSGKMNRDITGA